MDCDEQICASTVPLVVRYNYAMHVVIFDTARAVAAVNAATLQHQNLVEEEEFELYKLWPANKTDHLSRSANHAIGILTLCQRANAKGA